MKILREASLFVVVIAIALVPIIWIAVKIMDGLTHKITN
jgi:hypothetical protein